MCTPLPLRSTLHRLQFTGRPLRKAMVCLKLLRSTSPSTKACSNCVKPTGRIKSTDLSILLPHHRMVLPLQRHTIHHQPQHKHLFVRHQHLHTYDRLSRHMFYHQSKDHRIPARFQHQFSLHQLPNSQYSESLLLPVRLPQNQQSEYGLP